MRGGDRTAVAAECGYFSELGACVVFGVVWVLTKVVRTRAGAEVPWCQKGVVSSRQFSSPTRGRHLILRKSYELQMTQQNCKLVYAVQSECIWKGKSSHQGEIWRVTSSWLDPDASGTAEKRKK